MAKKQPLSWQRRSRSEAYNSEHFRYIDTIRRPDGTLRPWDEHDILVKYERYTDGNAGRNTHFSCLAALEIKDRESNEK